MSPITTHVLDTGRGTPAAGVSVILEHLLGEQWVRLGAGITDADGRQRTLLTDNHALGRGIYRLTFDTGAYFKAQRTTAFFPSVSVVFEVGTAEMHHHVPLLLSPFGYSTYRGS